MRLLWMMLALCSLSACQSVVVKDLDLIRPDKLTGYKTKGVFDQQKLSGISGQGQLAEMEIAVPAEGAEAVTIKGVKVNYPEAKNTVLYFGGNLTHVDENGPLLAKLSVSCPANFYTYDYRGYGRSNGEPNALLLKEDALRIYDDVRAKTTGKLIVYGYSLGGFMAGHIAANRTIDALILEGSGTSPADVVNAQIPWYAKPFVNVSFSDNLKAIDNLKAVSQYQGKALIVTGEKDKTMPADLGKKLFDTIPSQDKKYWMVANGSHSNLTNDPQTKQLYCEMIQSLY